MSIALRRPIIGFGLLLAALSFAPAPIAEPDQLSSRAQARYQSALKQYEETWSYYQQARIDSYQVYVWSRLVLDSRAEMRDKPADRVAALEDHLSRMRKLETLIKKVRPIGVRRARTTSAHQVLPFGSRALAGAGKHQEITAAIRPRARIQRSMCPTSWGAVSPTR